MKFLITGGLGFIGTNLIKFLLAQKEHEILNLDKITYAANSSINKYFEPNNLYSFIKGDICDELLVKNLLDNFKPDCIMNLAAESHVDKSISGPDDFIRTNIIGTSNLLNKTKDYWISLSAEKKNKFRFHHISTDEVFGSILKDDLFTEESRYDPSSPYAASKASSDHLVRAWHKTYGLPILISNCSNNYGPHQHVEKLIPNIINSLLKQTNIPIYGDGKNIRDWLYVDDHCDAIELIFNKGKNGETYNIGGDYEISNIDLANSIIKIFDEIKLNISGTSNKLIEFVSDRPGHDFRYAIDFSKIKKQLGWTPKTNFDKGIRDTINWYMSKK